MKRDAQLHVMLTTKELRRIKRAAQRYDRTVSEYVREAMAELVALAPWKQRRRVPTLWAVPRRPR